MKRRSKDIEIFSLSAIDLFAAAMGAFALLTIVLMPYYQKEIQERTPENALADLARAAQTSAVDMKDKRKALEAKRSASSANVSKIKSQADKLLAQLRAAEAALKEKKALAERAVIVPEPIEKKPAPTPKKIISSFRFLGMKTSKDDIVIALDMNRCMGGHEASVERAVERIIDSLQDSHALKVVGFQQTDAGPHMRAWPSDGRLRRVNAQSRAEAGRFTKNLTQQFGGSASMLNAFEALLSGPGQAIFLVSDGLPNPRANNGLTPDRLARQITRINAGRKEIHTVIVGNYFDYDGTVEFMEKLARDNHGQFMALASPAKGVCD
ncbi:MAG: hypothetical protein V3U57_01085 [Robiginitomaculum sp.]